MPCQSTAGPDLCEKCGTTRLFTSIYICMLCVLLLDATSILSPSKYKPHYSNSATLRMAVPHASASPMPSTDTGKPRVSYGYVPCILAVHDDITRCNTSYYQALNSLIVRGYKKESTKYKRQFCCGFWTRERCVTDWIQRKCEKKIIEEIQKDTNHHFVYEDTRLSSGISCQNFEQYSTVCSGSKSRFSSTWFGNSVLAVSALIYWMLLTYVL